MLQAGFKVVETFEAGQERTQKFSFVQYIRGSFPIICNPILKSLMAVEGSHFGEGFSRLIVGSAEVVPDSALDTLNNALQFKAWSLRAWYGRRHGLVESAKQKAAPEPQLRGRAKEKASQTETKSSPEFSKIES